MRKRKVPQIGEYTIRLTIFLFLTGSGGGPGSCESIFTITDTWSTTAAGSLHVTFPKTVSSWKIEIKFSSPVTKLTVWDGSNMQCSGIVCSFENLGWNGQQSEGNKVKIDFILSFTSLPSIDKVTLDGAALCSGSDEFDQRRDQNTVGKYCCLKKKNKQDFHKSLTP